MQTLFPPLAEEKGSNGGESVLPPGLRVQFEEMQAILRSEKCVKESDVLSNVSSSSTPEVGKKRKSHSSSSEEVADKDCNTNKGSTKNRKVELAVATALAVENEISRLKNGIAELEELLLQHGGGDSSADIAFPSLPAIVPSELHGVDQAEHNPETGEINVSVSTKEDVIVLKDRMG